MLGSEQSVRQVKARPQTYCHCSPRESKHPARSIHRESRQEHFHALAALPITNFWSLRTKFSPALGLSWTIWNLCFVREVQSGFNFVWAESELGCISVSAGEFGGISVLQGLPNQSQPSELPGWRLAPCTAGTLTLLLTGGKVSSQDRPKLPNSDPKVHLQVVHFYWNNKVLTPPLAPSLLKIILGLTHVNLYCCLLPLHLCPTQATLPLLLMSPSHVVTIILVKVSVLLIHYAFLKKISCWIFSRYFCICSEGFALSTLKCVSSGGSLLWCDWKSLDDGLTS